MDTENFVSPERIPDPSGPHSVLVVGCGSIGERHLRCFLETSRCSVTACDTSTNALTAMRDRYGVAGKSDWEAALASGEHSAVVICTHAPLHVPIALYALKNHVHTLIEKPLSHSLGSVTELLGVSKHSEAQTAVAYVLHANPLLVAAREYLRSGALGPIRQVTVTAGQPFHQLRPAYATTYYRDRKSGGGAIQDALTHSANWVESVIGAADSLLCDCAHQFLPDVDVEDTVHVSARHGEVLSNFTLNQFQQPNESTIQFNGDRGSVKIEIHGRRWGTFTRDATEWTWREVLIDGPDAPFRAQANAFLDQIEGQPARLCSVEAAAQTLRFNLAALASAESGARVYCRDLAD